MTDTPHLDKESKLTDQPTNPEVIADETTPGEGESAVRVTPVRVAPESAHSGPELVLTSKPVPDPKPADQKASDKAAAKQKARDEEAEESPFSVFVGQVYDGPLDLLLDLIRKQDIDIYDIPIAKITAQFLAYVNQLKATDVDVAGEFIYTASLLIHIKSKMLLPRAPSGPEDAAEDPRRELVEKLLEHERFKSAAQMLQQKQMLEAATWTNPGVREFKDDAAAEPEIAADTVDLVRIFRDILERMRKRPVFNVEEDSVTVGQMIQFLGRRLTMEDKPVALRRLLSHSRSERALIAMFLALLELVRLQAILLRQDRAFSEIFVKKHSGFDAVINDGLAQARDDWR
jgi:segregation and condensation protein A